MPKNGSEETRFVLAEIFLFVQIICRCLLNSVETNQSSLVKFKQSAKYLTYPAMAVHSQLSERDILMEFFESAEGTSWTSNSNWASDQPICTWYGITCEGSKVAEISLANNYLRGSLPSSLGQLNLTKLNLQENKGLGGTIPEGIFTMTNLVSLLLNDTSLAGSLPQTIDLPKLTILTLQSSPVEGYLPIALGRCVNLQYLHFDGSWVTANTSVIRPLRNLIEFTLSPRNGFHEMANLEVLKIRSWGFGRTSSGSIPSSIGQLLKLKRFELGLLDLVGTFPESILQLPSLETLHLEDLHDMEKTVPDFSKLLALKKISLWYAQPFYGQFPESLTKLPNLKHIEFRTDQFTGTIPDSIGNIGTLDTLFLYQHNFYGTIPASINNLRNLRTVFMSAPEKNTQKISGTIPPLSNLKNLEEFEITYTELSGTLPPFGEFPNLRILSITYSNITGTIPERLIPGSLEYLRIRSNFLSGTIPSQLGNLTNLLQFSVEFNQLTGVIPDIFEDSKLIYLYLNNNQFTGALPPSLLDHYYKYCYVQNNQFACPFQVPVSCIASCIEEPSPQSVPTPFSTPVATPQSEPFLSLQWWVYGLMALGAVGLIAIVLAIILAVKLRNSKKGYVQIE